MKSLSSMWSSAIKVASFLCIFTLTTQAAPPVLRWNGAAGGAWDNATANWLDVGSAAVPWQPGAEARFEGSGGLVNVAADVVVSNLTFTGSGYTLLGAGSLSVEGTLFVDADATNCVSVQVATTGGLSKIGEGALSLAQCNGALIVQSGTLIAAGSNFADADIAIASDATLLTLGEPDNASNLILNPGFELPAMTNGTWRYVAQGNVISNWNVITAPQFMGRQNTVTAGSPWNSIGSSPAGGHMLIMQYDSAIAQSVTVPADGIYSIAFSHLLRKGYAENQIYVTLDGIPLATFLNRNVEFAPGRFASAALYLKAGSHTLGFSGEGQWSDRASMIDAVCFAPPSAANPCRALAGDSALKAVTGATAQLSHSGSIPLAYVAIDGSVASGTFNSSHASGIFTGSGALACTTPGDVYTWTGTGLWSENVRWLDGNAPGAGGSSNLLMRFPPSNTGFSTNDLAGKFLCNRLTVAGELAGNPITLTNSIAGKGLAFSFAAPGKAIVRAPLTAYAPLTLDVIGELTIADNSLTVPNNAVFAKKGRGTLIVPVFTNTISRINIYEGCVQTPIPPSGTTVALISQSGKPASLCLTGAEQSYANRIEMLGSGLPTIATRAGGGTITGTDWILGFGARSTFDVGMDDTLSIRQMLMAYLYQSTGEIKNTELIKTGLGTLEIRSAGADSGNGRSYLGRTFLRSGTLRLSEDDYGTLNGWTNPFNGRVYDGKGGSLGYSAFTNAVVIGDVSTLPGDDLTLIAAGNGRWIGHNLEVMNVGNKVTLGMTAGTAMFAGTLTLHRDITLQGPADGIMVFGNIVAAPDFSGSGVPVLSGLGGVVIEGTVPAELSLLLDGRALSFGTLTAKATTLNALVIGSASANGTLEVDFDAGINDAIAVTMPGGLSISNTVVNLHYASTGAPFAEAGTYTLFTYAAPLGGDVSLLSIGNPQAGAGYAFSNDTANTQILLTISNASAGASVVWKKPASGNWDVGINWDTGALPDAASITPLFGVAITNPATVTLSSARTVGGLTFNNRNYAYTLTGGSLNLDAGGSTPQISLVAGSHTIDTVLNGNNGVAAAMAPDTLLVLGDHAVVNPNLSLATGTLEMRGNAAIAGAANLAASTLLRVAAPNASVGTLTGHTDARIAFADAASRLTVNQSAPSTFAGALQGTAGTLVKSGAATLTLTQPIQSFKGQAEVNGGTLALRAALLPVPVSIGASGTLSAMSAANTGLMGFYYSVTPTPANYETLAAMEAHFTTLTPNLTELSGTVGLLFDFGVGNTFNFPPPYNNTGSRSTNFEVVWRGVITVPSSGYYLFGVTCDDGYHLAIDGRTVNYRTAYNAAQFDGGVQLDAGQHDIVLGYFQATAGAGIKLSVRLPGARNFVTVPNNWLAPYASSGLLSGSGALTTDASSTAFRTVQNSADTTFSGTLAGPAGSLFAKTGNSTLRLSGSGGADNAFAGDLDVQGGALALTKSERLGDASTLSVQSGATLGLLGTETIGSLVGSGNLNLGGYIYVNAFADDADCDITPAKSYTHLLDFPANGNPATVNGVTFIAAALSGTSGSYGWSVTAGKAPASLWNTAPGDTTRSGVDRLLWDFYHDSTDYTFSLTGLTPGHTYETRLYFRSFTLGATRNVTFSFSTGATALGSRMHNIDAIARSWVGCCYVAGADGKLNIRMVSSTGPCHLYGLSNELVAEAVSTPELILTPTSGKNDRFSGPIAGIGTLVKSGAGTVRLSGANTLSTPLEVVIGTVVLEPGASLASGAAVALGATLAVPLGNVTLGSLTGAGTFDLTGSGTYATNTGPYTFAVTNDATSGISPDKIYTHLIDFGTRTTVDTVINGVAFSKFGTANGPAYGYSWMNFPPDAHGGNTPPVVPANSGMYNLLYDMNYNLASGNMRLTGLTVGKTYEIRFYNRRWATENRSQTFTFDPDGAGPISDPITFNPDQPGSPFVLAYRYMAATNELIIGIQKLNTGSYHCYGFSNEEVYDSQNNPATLNLAGDNVFDGAVTGPGTWRKTGVGTLTITGESTATGPLVVAAGAFGVAGGGCATIGPVAVAAGAKLFGDGLMGGTVTVYSNAVIHAGTAAVCGTLEIGDGLVVAPGALPRWRYSTGACDAIVVNGPLTFPTNGVLQVEALATQAPPPDKRAVFSSTQTILGPTDLTGWSVVGATHSTLVYSNDRKKIYFSRPNGTIIIIR